MTVSPSPSTFTVAPDSGRSLMASTAIPLIPAPCAGGVGGAVGVGDVGGTGVDDPEPHATTIVHASAVASLLMAMDPSRFYADLL